MTNISTFQQHPQSRLFYIYPIGLLIPAEVACEIGEMADHVVEQLKLLQQAVLGSRQALADAAETMYALRPQGE